MATQSDIETKRAQLCDKLEEYIKKVLKDDNPEISDDIENLRALLIAADCDQIRTVAKRVDLQYVFRRFITLRTSEDDLAEMSESLKSAFTIFNGALDPVEVLVEYEKLIVDEALNQRICSQDGIVIWLTKIIFRAITSPESFETLSKKILVLPLIERLFELLLAPTTKIATDASLIIKYYAQNHPKELFSPPLLTAMNRVQNHATADPDAFPFLKADNDVVRIRFFQLFADISSMSEEHMKVLSEATGASFVENFDMKFMNDPLIGINLVKILIGTLHCEHSRKHLLSRGIVQAFIDKILSFNHDDPLDMLILPSLYHFIIQFGYYDMKFLADNSKVLILLFQFLDTSKGNETTTELALDSIGFLSKDPAGKILLNNYDIHFLAPISILIGDSREIVQLSALSTLDSILHVDNKWNDDPKTLPAVGIAKSWFEQMNIDDYLVKKLTKYVHEPFQHVRLSTMKCLQNLVATDYGQKAMCDHKKFKDWLLNRKTESNSDGRENKWKIVNIIAQSKFVRQNFEGKEYLSLREYFKGGPIEPQVEVQDLTQ